MAQIAFGAFARIVAYGITPDKIWYANTNCGLKRDGHHSITCKSSTFFLTSSPTTEDDANYTVDLLSSDMGGCGSSLDCTTRSHITATTDIAGNGVLYAFLASALLTIAAIAYGYISDSLPEWYLNEVDRTVIQGFQSVLPSHERLHSIWHKLRFLVQLGHSSTKPVRRLTRRERQEAVTRFILSLSDQQLATGLAILVAAIANQCKLSVYEFEVAFCLAWFSSTTHLSTLDVLRDYFINHGVVRNWRVFGMVILMILLLYSFIISSVSQDVTLPVQCTFRFFGQVSVEKPSPLDTYLIVATFLTPIILIWSYAVRIYWSYGRSDDKASTMERMAFRMRSHRYRKRYKPTKKEMAAILEEAVLERRADIRRRHLERISKSTGFLRQWHIANRASKAYSESFLSLGPLIIFMVAFGFSQLYISRWRPDIPVDVDESMTFGQILPLFLLVIPIFAAVEIYYEVRDNGSLQPSKVSETTTPDINETIKTSPSALSSFLSDYPTSLHRTNLHDMNTLYNNLLPNIQRFYYLETKTISTQLSTAMTSDEYQKALQLQPPLLSTFHNLATTEQQLIPSLLWSAIEFFICGAASLAFGILINVEGPREASTIASVVLFSFYVAYVVAGLVFDVKDAWMPVSEERYKRLLDEVRSRGDGERLSAMSSYVTAASVPVEVTNAREHGGDLEEAVREKK